jgi:hypothetical protein
MLTCGGGAKEGWQEKTGEKAAFRFNELLRELQNKSYNDAFPSYWSCFRHFRSNEHSSWQKKRTHTMLVCFCRSCMFCPVDLATQISLLTIQREKRRGLVVQNKKSATMGTNEKE